jgi:signal transduction histidine kinase
LEEGKVENAKEEFNLEEFITSVVNETAPVCKVGQKLVYRHSGNAVVSLDKKLLKNILFNLISNAIKFSPEGKEIEITSSNNGAGVHLSVKDEGIGIPEEEQKHLFERFFRAHNATNIQGTGLGLNIVSKYAELMNGTINFTSAENKGTTFNLVFHT